MITSFSNPNYQLNDALNSNLPASRYLHDNETHIYEDLVTRDDDQTRKHNSAAKRRQK